MAPLFLYLPLKPPIFVATNSTDMETTSRKREIMRVTLIGSVGNLLLLIFKFIAGFTGYSSAMIADAVHSLSDFVTDVIVLLFVNISSKPKDEGHDYGHGKYETLATSIIGIVLLFVGIGLFWEGAGKVYGFFFRGEVPEAPGTIALIAAVASIVVKELLYQYTVRVGKKQNSQVVMANAWHHRSDAFSSIGTMVGIGGAILLGQQWSVLDPLAAVVVSVFIVKVSFTLILPSINELLERSLPKDMEEEILQIVTHHPEIHSPHNLRTRRIGNAIAIEVHVRVNGQMTVERSHAIMCKAEQELRLRFGNATHIALHVEPLK